MTLQDCELDLSKGLEKCCKRNLTLRVVEVAGTGAEDHPTGIIK